MATVVATVVEELGCFLQDTVSDVMEFATKVIPKWFTDQSSEILFVPFLSDFRFFPVFLCCWLLDFQILNFINLLGGFNWEDDSY